MTRFVRYLSPPLLYQLRVELNSATNTSAIVVIVDRSKVSHTAVERSEIADLTKQKLLRFHELVKRLQ